MIMDRLNTFHTGRLTLHIVLLLLLEIIMLNTSAIKFRNDFSDIEI